MYVSQIYTIACCAQLVDGPDQVFPPCGYHVPIIGWSNPENNL